MDEADGPEELGYGGARGGGKSHWMLAQMALDDCQRYPGLKGLLLRKIGKSVKEAFEDLRPKLLERIPHEWIPTRNILEFPNGSRIALGNFVNEGDVDKYLGLEYDVIGVEEATTLSWKKYEALLSVNRSSKPGWRPRVYTTTNPGGVGHAWYKKRFVLSARAGDETITRFIQATIDDNQFVDPDYRGKLDRLTGWLKRAWRYGDWDIAAGQFFVTWSQETHVTAPISLPAGWRYWLAMDYGFVHWNVVYLLAQDGDGNVYVVDEHAERRWLVNQHVEAINAMLARNGVPREWIYEFVSGPDVFARRGDEKTIADKYQEAGWRLTAAQTDRVNGAAEVLARLGNPEAGIAPTLFIFARCRRLIECLPAMQHDPNRPEDVLKVDCDADTGDGGDDPYDTLRYGLMAKNRTLGVMRYRR